MAQNIFEVTAVTSATYENMVVKLIVPQDGKNKLGFGYKWSYAAGVEYKYYLDPGWSVSAGLMYQDKGFRQELRTTTSDSLDGNSQFSNPVLVGSARYVTMPLNINAHIKVSRKFRVLLSGGISYGRLVSQNLIGKRIPNDLVNDYTTTFEVEPGESNIKLFSPRYFVMNAGIGFTKYIHDKLAVTMQPWYTWQLNSALDPDAATVGGDKIRFNSFMIDLRVGYYFNPQIKNKGKDF